MNIKNVIKVFLGIFKYVFYITFLISCGLIIVGAGYFIDLLMTHIQIIHIVIASLFMLLFVSMLCIYKHIMNEVNINSPIKNTYLFWFGGSGVFIGSYLASRQAIIEYTIDSGIQTVSALFEAMVILFALGIVFWIRSVHTILNIPSNDQHPGNSPKGLRDCFYYY